MQRETLYIIKVAVIAALGGFLMGFDASVISGVVGFIEVEFSLTKIQLGWSVASLTLTATIAMMVAGPLSDRFGRRTILKLAALLFAISAITSAIAPDFISLVLARMLGGFGVGAALILAPLYIAEIAPAAVRGRMVSVNQLNIVLGISAAFFSNYLILTLGQGDASWAQSLKLGEWGWRWMLGLETLPAVIYLVALYFIPESPRWLAMHGREDEALQILARVTDEEQAKVDLQHVHESIHAESQQSQGTLKQLFAPAMKLVLTIGISVAILQQLTGINAVFFYAPMIFEQSGIGTDATFMQAVLVGLVNIVFTVAAMVLIDRIGRRPLLGIGLGGIAVCMMTLAYGFGSATYQLDKEAIASLPDEIDKEVLMEISVVEYGSDIEFREAISGAIGSGEYKKFESQLVSSAIDINPMLILAGILGFVASFAISLGPVMWVLFSEMFPNTIRGIAISFVGLINSAVSFGVQFLFPWNLENLGNSMTFLFFGVVAIIGFVFVMRIMPETRGRSLEELEQELVKA